MINLISGFEIQQEDLFWKTIIAYRDPTKEDTTEYVVFWISKEYSPHRVFKGYKGDWSFVGKFYPHEK